MKRTNSDCVFTIECVTPITNFPHSPLTDGEIRAIAFERWKNQAFPGTSPDEKKRRKAKAARKARKKNR